MNTVSPDRHLIDEVPLYDIAGHYGAVNSSGLFRDYAGTVLRLCPEDGTTCEVDSRDGYASVWLSLRGVKAINIAADPQTQERNRHVADILGGNVQFQTAELFDALESGNTDGRPGIVPNSQSHYHVIHHQNLVNRMTVPQIHATLASQLLCADHVVFTVPSVYSSLEPLHEDERLLPLVEWHRILQPFDVIDLRYSDGTEQILCVVRGCGPHGRGLHGCGVHSAQDAAYRESLFELSVMPSDAFPEGITAIVHTRNEAHHIEACLESLRGWTDEIIICDMESSDDTVALARRYTNQIIAHPLISNFDRARNVSAMRAKYRWVFYLDADERVPEALGQALRDLTRSQGESFEALLPPFRHHFSGRWLQSLYPGYTSPRLFKNGRFYFRARLHAGAHVDGRTVPFPADDPNLALVHYSYDSLSHYFAKFDRYTTGEAANMHRDGEEFHWKKAIAHFATDLCSYYDGRGAAMDEVHGLIYSFLGGIYRFGQHAKLYERHFHEQRLTLSEREVPSSVEELLEFALTVVRQQNLGHGQNQNGIEHENIGPEADKPTVDEHSSEVMKHAATPLATEAVLEDAASIDGAPITESQDEVSEVGEAEPIMDKFVTDKPVLGDLGDVDPLRVRWEGDQFCYTSLANVNRELCTSLLDSKQVELSLITHGPSERPPIGEARFNALETLRFKPLSGPADVHVSHLFPPRLTVPAEGHFVWMQPWEYGYLPKQWIEPVQQHVSEVWCYSEYVRNVYIASGIPEEKLKLVPLGVNTDIFHPAAPRHRFTSEPGVVKLVDRVQSKPFMFLFVGGTLDRKGIDILLEAYSRAFTDLDDVCLIIKDTGTNTVYRGYNFREQILEQVAEPTGTSIIYIDDDLAAQQMAGIYTAADCLVQPYRGEGFCLPALEAMACGIPVITPEGGPTDDFVDSKVGWRIAADTRIIPGGHVGNWECVGRPWMFEVSPKKLARLMREVYLDRDGVKQRGAAAAQRVQQHWTWQHSAAAVLERLQVLRETKRPQRGEIILPVCISRDATKHSLHDGPSKVGTSEAMQPEGSSLSVNTEKKETYVAQDERSHDGVSQDGVSQDEVSKHEVSQHEVSQDESHPAINENDNDVRKNSELAGKGHDGSRLRGNGTTPIIGNSHLGGKSLQVRKAPTISLCMIVKNEERVLDACLSSIKPWVDEIIIVDTGSTDRTVTIAEEHGAKMVHFPWTDSFSEARNVSLEHATGDWIFWMDADDTIPEECGAGMREVVLLAEQGTTGFLMQVHIPPAPDEEGYTIVDHVKLFRNWPQLRFEGRIHEQILESIHRSGGTVERTNLYVVHSGYDHSPEGQVRKRERDWSLLEKDLAERPDHPFVLFNIGMTAYHTREFDRALPPLLRCLEICKPRESITRKVYAMLAGCYLEKAELTEAQSLIERGLKLFPRDPELLFRGGIVYREAGNLEAAERCYQTLLQGHETGHIDSIDVSMTGFKAHHNLALIYMDMGRTGEAENQWRAAVHANPRFVQSWLGLGDICLRQGRGSEVMDVAGRVQELDPGAADALRHHAGAAGLLAYER
jgi:glycosyltransferase involved in cell wall biosynthesis